MCMKKLVIILLFFAYTNLSILAIEDKSAASNLDNKKNTITSKQANQTINLKKVNLYDYFYKKGEYDFLQFNPLSENEILLLDKDSKRIYKKVVKSEKCYRKALKYNSNTKKEINFLHKAIKYNPQNYNAIALLSEAYLFDKKFDEAITCALYLIELNKPEFNYMYATAGYGYHFKEKYQDSIKYINKYLKFSNNTSYSKSTALYFQGENYFELKNYAKAINYANLSLNEKDIYDEKACISLKYYSYLNQNNKKLAKQEAWKLIKINDNAENYLRLAYSTDNQNEKLGYLNIAKAYYKEPVDIFKVNYEIAKIEQNKINNAHKTIKTYSPRPEWRKISNENVGSITYWNNRQDEFFKATNSCISNYKGANLAKCFESVIDDEKEKTEILKKNIYEAQMLQLQQQQINAIQYNNYLQRTRYY